MNITTNLNFRVRAGDMVGADPVLKCCGGHAMTSVADKRGGTSHSCCSCGTRALVDAIGRVIEINH